MKSITLSNINPYMGLTSDCLVDSCLDLHDNDEGLELDQSRIKREQLVLAIRQNQSDRGYKKPQVSNILPFILE